MAQLAPSILSADFAYLARDINEVDASGVSVLHVDVMDGVFVPNISIGIPVVQSLRKVTKSFLDTHLMIVHPEKYIADFAKAGADGITIHYEATENLAELLTNIRALGKKSGVSIKPATSPDVLTPYLDLLDCILIMSVEPGFGGQSFIDGSLEKITETKNIIGERPIVLEVDGGVTLANAKQIKDAGATLLVAGSAVFNHPEGILKACEVFQTVIR